VYMFELGRTKELIESSIELITNMSSDERKLLRMIEKHGDRGLLLTSKFKRTESKNRQEGKYHETLQSLHNRSLIRPSEKGPWRQNKYALLTPICRLLLKEDEVRKQMIEEGEPTWWDREYDPPFDSSAQQNSN